MWLKKYVDSQQKLALMVFSLLFACVLHAASPHGRIPADPVQDAKDSYAAGEYEFASIELADHVELPGLNESQQKVVREKYQMDSLNYRWKTFANVEDDPQRLLNMRRYATRYNLMLWKLLQAEKKENKFRYRY